MVKASLFLHGLGRLQCHRLAICISWVFLGITENKMETSIVYWGYIGIMENVEAVLRSVRLLIVQATLAFTLYSLLNSSLVLCLMI